VLVLPREQAGERAAGSRELVGRALLDDATAVERTA